MRKGQALLGLAVAAVIAGCGSSSSSSNSSTASASAGTSSSSTSATSSGAVNPNAPESLPPGDIPDTIAYVPYSVPGDGLTVSAPEGWSRRTSPGGVTFTDKLNTIQVIDAPAAAPLTVATARGEVPKLAVTLKGFKLQSISTVSRPAGTAVKILYQGYSKPDPVTGKFGVLAFERYVFSHGRRQISLVLSSPRGSDNVDPWRKVTSSLSFSR